LRLTLFKLYPVPELIVANTSFKDNFIPFKLVLNILVLDLETFLEEPNSLNITLAKATIFALSS